MYAQSFAFKVFKRTNRARCRYIFITKLCLLGIYYMPGMHILWNTQTFISTEYCGTFLANGNWVEQLNGRISIYFPAAPKCIWSIILADQQRCNMPERIFNSSWKTHDLEKIKVADRIHKSASSVCVCVSLTSPHRFRFTGFPAFMSAQLRRHDAMPLFFCCVKI